LRRPWPAARQAKLEQIDQSWGAARKHELILAKGSENGLALLVEKSRPGVNSAETAMIGTLGGRQTP